MGLFKTKKASEPSTKDSPTSGYYQRADDTDDPPLITNAVLVDPIPVPTTPTPAVAVATAPPAPFQPPGTTVVAAMTGEGGSKGSIMKSDGGKKLKKAKVANNRAPIIDYTLGRHPVLMTCPLCNQGSNTRTKTYPNWATWLSVGGLMVAFWPICWIPLVCDSMKRTDHICLKCGGCVGSVQPYSDCCLKERG